MGLFGASVAGVALGEASPLNRVWSFPSKIVVPKRELVGSLIEIRMPQCWALELGDIVTVGDWPWSFVVTGVEPEILKASSPSQKIMLRGLTADGILSIVEDRRAEKIGNFHDWTEASSSDWTEASTS